MPAIVPRSGLRVLLIDDSEDLREVLGLHLDRFFEVHEAATVEQALTMVAKDTRYDAVICDLMMPRGGAEIWLARCASVDPGLDARTIVLTGGPTTTAARELVEQRPQQVLYKPFEIDVLRSMIERVADR
jgi:DNA-binding NtrC family response regulator